jgi:ribosomal protein S30
MAEVTLPAPPEGYEYKLVSSIKKSRPRIKDKDPSELTPRQKATLKYNEKNREKINEKSLNRYHEKKK